MRTLAFFLIIAGLLGPVHEAWGKRLLQMDQLSRVCRDFKNSYLPEGQCHAFAYEALKQIRQGNACPPASANEYDIIAILHDWREEHPEVRDLGMKETAAIAMPGAFPCE